MGVRNHFQFQLLAPYLLVLASFCSRAATSVLGVSAHGWLHSTESDLAGGAFCWLGEEIFLVGHGHHAGLNALVLLELWVALY